MSEFEFIIFSRHKNILLAKDDIQSSQVMANSGDTVHIFGLYYLYLGDLSLEKGKVELTLGDNPHPTIYFFERGRGEMYIMDDILLVQLANK